MIAEWVLAALLALPTWKEDRSPDLADVKSAQLVTIAEAVATVSVKAPRPAKEWAALLITLGYAESTFSLRIHAGDCRHFECDRGRARSPWQLQKNTIIAPVWEQLHGVQNTAIQVRAADAMLRRSLTRCRGFAPFPDHVWRAYRGGSCSFPLKDEAARTATYVRVLATAAAKKGAS